MINKLECIGTVLAELLPKALKDKWALFWRSLETWNADWAKHDGEVKQFESGMADLSGSELTKHRDGLQVKYVDLLKRSKKLLHSLDSLYDETEHFRAGECKRAAEAAYVD